MTMMDQIRRGISKILYFTKWTIILTIVIGVIIGLLTLFTPLPVDSPSEPNTIEEVPVENLDGDVHRFTDPDTGATCYVYNDDSISCIGNQST